MFQEPVPEYYGYESSETTENFAIDNKPKYIINDYSNKCLYTDNSSKDNGALVKQWNCTDRGDGSVTNPIAQQFVYENKQLKNVNSGKCLTISGRLEPNFVSPAYGVPRGDFTVDSTNGFDAIVIRSGGMVDSLDFRKAGESGWSGIKGGKGGSKQPDSFCGDKGGKVVGMYGKSGKYIDRIGFICTDGSKTPAGGGSNGTDFEFKCPQGSFIKTFKGAKGNILDGLQATCAITRNESGKEVIQWDCGKNDPSQSFTYDEPTKRFTNEGSKKCLGISGNLSEYPFGELTPGARLIQWDCHGGQTQKFNFQDLPLPKYFNEWKSFGNSLSDPNFLPILKPDAPKTIVKTMMEKGVYDFFPFKIVPLWWLNEQGKVMAEGGSWGRTFKTDKVGPIVFVRFQFKKDDAYLPVGDIVIRESPTQYWTTYVLLVRNDPKYAIPVDPKEWTYMLRSRGCNYGGEVFGFRGLRVKDRISKEKYISMGEVFKWGKENADKTWYDPVEPGRHYAVVDQKYLRELKGIESDSAGTMVQTWNGDYSCRYRMRVTLSDAFNNFVAIGDEDTSGGGRSFGSVWGSDVKLPGGEYWPKYVFFDIVPQFLIANCCSKNLPEGVDQTACGTYWTEDRCKFAMNEYCKGSTLLKDDCYTFCKDSKNNCNTSLQSFCQSATEEQKKNPNFEKTCSCFLSQKFYQDWQEETIKDLDAETKKVIRASMQKYPPRAHCDFPLCVNANAIKPFQAENCPTVAIQQCINKSTFDMAGANFEKSPIDASQVNQCVQNVTDIKQVAPPSGPAATPATIPKPTVTQTPTPPKVVPKTTEEPETTTIITPSPKSDEAPKGTNWGLIGGVVFLLLIIIIGIVYANKAGADVVPAPTAPQA